MSLFNTMSSGVSAMQSFSQGLEVIGNNIANVNTTGFKTSNVSFADSFSTTMRGAGPSTATNSNTPAVQIGTGVGVAGIASHFSQGSLSTTAVPTDLGISGNGFFLVEDVATGEQFATRNGNFRIDDSGYLVTSTGLQVQGLTGGTAAASPATAGAIQVGQTASGNPVSFSFDDQGNLVEYFSDGSSIISNQVQLVDFVDAVSLTREGSGLYSGFGVAGSLGTDDPGANGRGVIKAGTLELSNVDLTEEFANMIGIQRSFQASSRLVTVSDSVLEEIVNLKR